MNGDDPSTPDTDAFLRTLPHRGRLVARRVESFGDIVVGFSMSQLALQLGLPRTTADLIDNPFRYALFFGTFAIIALLWLRFHRMLTMAFAPGRIDLVCAFAYLAFVALLPYALYANAKLSHDVTGARYGLASYAICLLGSSIAAFVLSLRSARRARGVLDDVDVARLAARTWIEGGIGLVYAGVLAVDFAFGPAYAGTVFLTIPLVTRAVKTRYRPRSWDAVHVGERPRPRIGPG